MGDYCDDGKLVKRVLDGDTDLFGELISRHQLLVYGLAYSKVSDFTDAQDIAQEVFIKAYRKLDQLERPEDFAVWLKAITANESKNWLRQRKATIALDDAELQPSYAAHARADRKEQEFRAEVRQSIEALSEDHRTVVTLHYLSGLTYREIGESLCISVAAVANRLLRARKQLAADQVGDIRAAMANGRLPSTFTQEIIRRISLHPVEAGRMCGMAAGNEHVVALGMPDERDGIVLIALPRDDVEAILSCIGGRPVATPRARMFLSMKDAMDASGVDVKQIILYLDKESSCRARAVATKGGIGQSLSLSVSDALFLASRSRIPTFAEGNLISKGIAGTDGHSYDVLDDFRDFRPDLPLISQRSRLMRAAFNAAPLANRGKHSVRCWADLTSDSLQLCVLGTDIAVGMPLRDHLPAFEYLCSMSDDEARYSWIEDDEGHFYGVTYAISDGELAISFSPYPGVPGNVIITRGPHLLAD